MDIRRLEYFSTMVPAYSVKTKFRNFKRLNVEIVPCFH